MEDDTQQSQEANESNETQGSSEQSQATNSNEERMVPYHRFREINDQKRSAEERLQAMEEEFNRQEEERSKKQGEWQQVAEKRLKKVENLERENADLKTKILRDERYRAFLGGANGVILPEALGDAFSMLTDEDFEQANTEDEGSYRMLAQNLADRKPYLATGLRGSGSRGSAHPVFGNQQQTGKKRMHFKKRGQQRKIT